MVHDLFVLTNPEWFSRKYSITHAPVLRAQMASAAAIVTVSPVVAEQVSGLVGRSKRVVVAPNAPADEFLRATPAASVKVPSEVGERPFMLCVGSMDPRKNLRLLIDAYAGLPVSVRKEVRLVLVGAKSGNFSSAATASGTDPEGVIRLGYVSDVELATLYRAAEVVLFPSLAEGFGLPIVEALGVGARVIASDIPVFRWVGGDMVTFVDPHSEKGWRTAMQRIADGGGHVCEGPHRRELAGRFSWDASAARIMDLVTGL
ncbi:MULTISPECIES: glycosyltransferase family 1 protein [Aeromicrobium]|uniref:glycosyltransferase family 4 protein n=1 Tax=Aeromicrobium TaxID=2040 RepID=UPI001CA95566|nr:glycosyltransferase family 1 protein [Aeromicrobium sp. 636]